MNAPYYADDQVTLYHGDCLQVLAGLPDSSVDAVVTDPPYGLEFMGKDWDAPWKATGDVVSDPADVGGFQDGSGGNPFSRSRIRFGIGVGFQSWCETWATECLRVLKPGGHMLAFGGSRTHHRLICAIEDAGFEIRDAICWIFASGFPKSLNVTAALDRTVPPDARCACGPRSTRTAPSSQSGYPSCRDSGDEQLLWGPDTDLDDVPSQDDVLAHNLCDQHGDGRGSELANTCADGASGHPANDGSSHPLVHPLEDSHSGASAQCDKQMSTSGAPDLERHRTRPRTQHTSDSADDSASSYSPNKYMACSKCGKVVVPQGLGTALKPAMEIISVARKPLQGTVAQTVMAHGTGALNIDGCRVGDDVRVNQPGSTKPRVAMGGGWREDAEPTLTTGRWPANVLLDGSQADALDKESGTSVSRIGKPTERIPGSATDFAMKLGGTTGYEDEGGASRFFPTFHYTAKAPGIERPSYHRSSCECEDSWPTTSPVRATAETATPQPGSSTSKSGNATTADQSQTATKSTTSTSTSSTTAPTICSPSPLPSTSDSTRDASCARESGLSPAESASSSSLLTSETGTSAAKAGRSMAAADRATSQKWSKTSVCGNCGAPARLEAHATVKPVELMRWLIRLVTPPNGVVLDPFAGSGTTGEAAIHEHKRCILIEREPTYLPLIVARIHKPMQVGFDFEGIA